MEWTLFFCHPSVTKYKSYEEDLWWTLLFNAHPSNQKRRLYLYHGRWCCAQESYFICCFNAEKASIKNDPFKLILYTSLGWYHFIHFSLMSFKIPFKYLWKLFRMSWFMMMTKIAYQKKTLNLKLSSIKDNSTSFAHFVQMWSFSYVEKVQPFQIQLQTTPFDTCCIQKLCLCRYWNISTTLSKWQVEQNKIVSWSLFSTPQRHSVVTSFKQFSPFDIPTNRDSKLSLRIGRVKRKAQNINYSERQKNERTTKSWFLWAQKTSSHFLKLDQKIVTRKSCSVNS